MDNGLTQDEIHLLLKDMAGACLQPPDPEALRLQQISGAELPQERVSVVGRICRRLDVMRPWSLLALLAMLLAPLAALTLMVALAGPLPSLSLLAASALAGGWVVHKQGRHAFRSFSECLAGIQVGRLISLPTAERAVKMAAGLLLLLPDPLSSLAGLMLLTPDLRRGAARWVQRQSSPVFVLH